MEITTETRQQAYNRLVHEYNKAIKKYNEQYKKDEEMLNKLVAELKHKENILPATEFNSEKAKAKLIYMDIKAERKMLADQFKMMKKTIKITSPKIW